MTRPPQPFGVQAARFSLYAPFAVFLIGFLTIGNREKMEVVIAIFSINMLLIVSGFVLGIVALLSMRRHGRKGILGRAVVGLLLNGMVLTATTSLAIPLLHAGNTRLKVVGHWRMQSSPAIAAQQAGLEVTFNKDGAFRLDRTVASEPKVTLNGTWVLTQSRMIGVTLETGEKLGIGRIKTIDEQQMILGTDRGDEVYTRLP